MQRLKHIRSAAVKYIAEKVTTPAPAGNNTVKAVSTLWDCAAGDQIQLAVIQGTGGNLNTVAAAWAPQLWAFRTGT